VTLRYDRFIMKASVRLELQQAEVRSLALGPPSALARDVIP
jgi:hypothetical protein